MHAERVRPIAICVCRDGDRILVTEFNEKNRLYYRPLGGTIEFHEKGEAAVRREFHEEIQADLEEVRYLGALENIYTNGGLRGHEIVLVYDGRLADVRLYDKEELPGDELGEPFRAVWKRLDEFGPGKPPLYPNGLLELLGK
jgi:ADP-ribose pyrophosphatase YjhB (NUDIX family)